MPPADDLPDDPDATLAFTDSGERQASASPPPPTRSAARGQASASESAGWEDGGFEHYTIRRGADGEPVELGRGAMGVTYKALDTRLHCDVALKVIRGDLLARHPNLRERFLREARGAARLRHANVASVFHLGENEERGVCFYAMEFIEGETLQARVQRSGPLPAALVVEIGLQVARALVAAGQQGLVHRDLKPANLMLVASRGSTAADGESSTDTDEPLVKVIDFGLVKATTDAGDLTSCEGFVGTPQFASPEQIEGRADQRGGLDTRSDIYSLGATMWYALTGKAPFAGRSLVEIYDRQTNQPLPLGQLVAARVPVPVCTLLAAMLARDPADRPPGPGALVEALRQCRATLPAAAPIKTGWSPAVPRAVGMRRRSLVAGAFALVILALAAGWAIQHFRPTTIFTPPPVREFTPPDKSIAVLPFKNLSTDPANQFFADAVQDEILINLSHVADLKVISRTSVLDYRDPGTNGPTGAAPRNLPQIARAVNVAHIVEGSVQRSGNQIRITAELIDARTDAHLWAEKYSRPLDDLFAVQSEIAQAIAGQLRAKLSPQEKASIDEAPTHNLAAYQLYREAWQKWNAADVESKALFDDLTGLLRQAIALDPEFIRARLFLTNLLAFVYRNGYEDSTRAAEAVRQEAEAIDRLRPGSGEAHHAEGFYEYYVRLDYGRAQEEFALAAQALPNDPEVHLLLGLIDRRMNRWDNALAEMEKAAVLDPANMDVALKRVLTLALVRRYPEAHRQLETLVALHPGVIWNLTRATLIFDERADLAPMRDVLAHAPADFDPEGEITKARFSLGLWEHDFDVSARALAASSRKNFPGELPVQKYSREALECLLAHARGDADAARTHAVAALPEAQTALAARPDDPARVMVVAILNAALGEKEMALTHGRHAIELAPIKNDAFLGPQVALQFARVLAWTGERAAALDLLTDLAARPGGPSYGNLRRNPDWEGLRGDARFEAVLVVRAPREKGKAP